MTDGVLFPVLGGGDAHGGFELADKVFHAVVSTLFCDLQNRQIAGCQQFTGVFDPADDNLLHAGGMKIFLVDSMQISGADVEFFRHIGNCPFLGRLPVNLFSKGDELVIDLRERGSFLFVGNHVGQRVHQLVQKGIPVGGYPIVLGTDDVEQLKNLLRLLQGDGGSERKMVIQNHAIRSEMHPTIDVAVAACGISLLLIGFKDNCAVRRICSRKKRVRRCMILPLRA